MDVLNRIHYLAQFKRIRFTSHAHKRAVERSIDIIKDILPALMNCEIVEEYPDDYPYESYLVLGKTDNNNPIHIVCSIVEDELWIITEYFPDNKKWEEDLKTRKE